MSKHFHDPSDLNLLKEMGKLAPAEFSAWLNLDKIVGRDGGTIPRKHRELIALGVACTTQCPYCIRGHTRAALRHGATPEELMEAIWVAAEMRAGGAYAHSALALDEIARHEGEADKKPGP